MYVKLFNSIITSTIWMESDQTRIVWITMLALADKNGEVQASVPGLARIAGVSLEACRAALESFLGPDLESRTKDDEGRRIEEIDGGWSLLNYRKYRDMASKEDSKNAETRRKARYRARLARNSTKCPGVVPGLSTVTPHIAEAEAEAEEYAAVAVAPVIVSKRFAKPTISQLDSYAIELEHPEFDSEAFVDYYDSVGWVIGKNKPMKDWKSTVRRWIKKNEPPKKKTPRILYGEERERVFLRDMHKGAYEP